MLKLLSTYLLSDRHIISYMRNSEYYTIFAISITSLVPVICGIIYYCLAGERRNLTILKRNFPLVLISTLFLLILILFADPVKSEGWLRGTFIILLFTVESVVIYFLLSLTSSALSKVVISLVSFLFMAAVPAGLILHHPWNYIMFISPFYWLSWSWIVPSVAESFIYAAIAMILTTLYLKVSIRLFNKKQSG